MDLKMIEDVFNDVSNSLVGAMEPAAHAISIAISPLMGACLGLYVVYYGFKYLYDPPDIPVMDVVKNLAALAVVSLFAFNLSYYMHTVVPFVMGAGDDLAKAISGQNTVAAQLDGLTNQLTGLIATIWHGMDFSVFNSQPFFMGLATIILIGIGAVAFIVVSIAYLLIAKIMVCLLLAVGSIFICMAFYPPTRSNFQQWCGQCMNYIFLTILYSVAFSIEIVLIQKYALGSITPPTVPQWDAALKLCILMLSFTAVSLEIPSLASHLAGGVGISGLVGSAAGRMMGAAAGGAFGALGGRALAAKAGNMRNAAAAYSAQKGAQGAAWSGKQAYRGARWAGQKAAQGARWAADRMRGGGGMHP